MRETTCISLCDDTIDRMINEMRRKLGSAVESAKKSLAKHPDDAILAFRVNVVANNAAMTCNYPKADLIAGLDLLLSELERRFEKAMYNVFIPYPEKGKRHVEYGSTRPSDTAFRQMHMVVLPTLISFAERIGSAFRSPAEEGIHAQVSALPQAPRLDLEVVAEHIRVEMAMQNMTQTVNQNHASPYPITIN